MRDGGDGKLLQHEGAGPVPRDHGPRHSGQTQVGETYTTFVPAGSSLRNFAHTKSRTFAGMSAATVNGGVVMASRHRRTASSIGFAGPRSTQATPPLVITNAR